MRRLPGDCGMAALLATQSLMSATAIVRMERHTSGKSPASAPVPQAANSGTPGVAMFNCAFLTQMPAIELGQSASVGSQSAVTWTRRWETRGRYLVPCIPTPWPARQESGSTKAILCLAFSASLRTRLSTWFTAASRHVGQVNTMAKLCSEQTLPSWPVPPAIAPEHCGPTPPLPGCVCRRAEPKDSPSTFVARRENQHFYPVESRILARDGVRLRGPRTYKHGSPAMAPPPRRGKP